MKNLSLLSVVSLLALTMGAPSLFAAEREVPPGEAAPARQRAEPARRAARPAQPARPAPQTTSWTGNQAGGFGGGNVSAGNFTDPVLHPFAPVLPCGVGAFCGGTGAPSVPFSFDSRKGSFTGGGFIGTTVQFGNIVYGIEGDIAGKANSEDSSVQTTTTVATYSAPAGVTPPTAARTDVISGSVRQGTDGSIRGRIGWLLNPWTLAYLTGGVAFNHVSASYSYASSITYAGISLTGTPLGAVDTLAGSASVDKTLTGGTVGGGVEFIVAQGWKARLEYRWSGFGNYSFDVPLTRTCAGAGCAAVSFPAASTSAHIDIGNIAFHTFRAGLAFGF